MLSICVFLDCDLPIQLLLKSLSSEYDYRLVDLFHHIPSHVTNYEICVEHVMHEQLNLYVFYL